MENKLNIYQRMLLVMTEVQVVQKEDKKVNGQYKYVSHDAVSKAVHMPMVKAGIYMQPDVIDMKQDGNRTEIMMTMAFINVDKPDDRIVLKIPGYGIDTQDKGIGKAISYATKYGYLKAFCLETGDDVEKDNIDHVPGNKEKKSNTLSQVQINTINACALQRPNSWLEKVLKSLDVICIEDIPVSEFERTVKFLTKLMPDSKVTPMVTEGVKNVSVR